MQSPGVMHWQSYMLNWTYDGPEESIDQSKPVNRIEHIHMAYKTKNHKNICIAILLFICRQRRPSGEIINENPERHTIVQTSV